MDPSFDLFEYGQVDYLKAHDQQLRLVEKLRNEKDSNGLFILLEHYPVFTLGRRGDTGDLLVPEEKLDRMSIPAVRTERGGNITYHGPGQIVVYPILKLDRLKLSVVELVEMLEEVMIQTAGHFGVRATRSPGKRGVWAGEKKLGSIGIAIRKSISFHGMALNIDMDLTPFNWINPCGIKDVEMTSIQNEIRHPVSMADARQVVKMKLSRVFKAGLVEHRPKMRQGKPAWLKRPIARGSAFESTRRLVSEKRLNTVCQEAICPNIWECFSSRTATFLILGDRCTRNCRFCAVKSDIPAPVDPEEPERIAEAAASLGLHYAVITSVTRDDLPDGGAMAFAETIRRLKERIPSIRVEVLIPDFAGNVSALERIIAAGPDVVNHNIETVPRLYESVRPMADYRRSIDLLAQCRRIDKSIPTKSGMMLGLGESPSEVHDVFDDLIRAGCRILTLGQYLRPTLKQLPVKRYLCPPEFEILKFKAYRAGFEKVVSSPLARSSYLAHSAFNSVANQRA